MEFGSKYVYCYADSDEESVSDEEFTTGITDESNPLEQEPTSSSEQAKGSRSKGGKKGHRWAKPMAPPEEEAAAAAAKGDEKKWRQADTNVVAVRFDQLTNPSNMHTGDAVSCRHCRAVMSHMSVIKDSEADQKVWQCEFCDERNVVDILAEEIPSEPDVTYMISPAPATVAASCQGEESSMVIFCIDVSGSMSGRVGNLSRLECVKAAVLKQLKQLRDEHPTRKVALVTFDTEVSIYGDGSHAAKIVGHGEINDYDKLVNIGTEAAVPADVKSSFSFLHDKISTLSPGSSTALGPALLISVFMASKMVGSKVILCTDGCANVGLGSIEMGRNYSAGSDFYLSLGETASSKGVVVSVLTVADTDCRLIEIGNVAQATGGHVNVVDPRKLTDELGEIFVSNLIAVRVSATFIVHRGLYVRHESEMTSSVTRDVGNVTKDVDITFEYGVRPETTWSKKSSTGEGCSTSSMSETPSELPFQLQVTYTDLDGTRAMRVLTQVQPVTSDRTQAESHINVPVVTCHASKQSSKMAMDGDYTPARLNALMYQRLVARNTGRDRDSYRVYSDKMRLMEQTILQQQQREAASCRSTVPHYENLYPDACTTKTSPGMGSKLNAYYKQKGGALDKFTRRSKQSDVEAKDRYIDLKTTVSELKSSTPPRQQIVRLPLRIRKPPAPPPQETEKAAAAEQTVDETRPSTSEETSKDDDSPGRDDTSTDQMRDTASADTAAGGDAGTSDSAEQASAGGTEDVYD